MKPYTTLATFLLISACVAPTLISKYEAGESIQAFYRANASWSDVSTGITNCEVYAAQQVPPNLQMQTSPTFNTPATTFCNQIGSQVFCNTTGGKTVGGDVSSYDANSDLRSRVFSQCMASTGHVYATLRPCPEGAKISWPGRLPPLTDRVCYKPTSEMAFQVFLRQ
jgi:hypothetical protein